MQSLNTTIRRFFVCDGLQYFVSPAILIEMFSKNSAMGSLSFFGDDDVDDDDDAAAAPADRPLSSTLRRVWFSKLEATQMSPPSNFSLDKNKQKQKKNKNLNDFLIFEKFEHLDRPLAVPAPLRPSANSCPSLRL